MKFKHLSSPLVYLLVAAVVLALVVPAGRLLAQSSTEDKKIRLLAEALRARDAGDYVAADNKLAELAVIVPNDPSIVRFRSELAAAARARQAAALRAAEEASERAAQQARTAAATPAPAPARPLAAAEAPPMIDVKIPEPAPRSVPAQAPAPVRSATPAAPVVFNSPPAAESASAVSAAAEAEADALVAAESARISAALARAKAQRATAKSQARDGEFEAALATLDLALAGLPVNSLTRKTITELKRDKASVLYDRAQSLLARGDTEGARGALAAAAEIEPGSARGAGLSRQLTRAEVKNPKAAIFAPAAGVDAEFLAERAALEQLIAKGRAQYVAGDIDGAQSTFRSVEAQAPDNTVAKGFLLRIAQEKAETGALNREKTRTQLLEEVAKGWQRPGIYQERSRDDAAAAATAPLLKKINEIVLPTVSFTRAEIGQVVAALSAASEEYDTTGVGPKGANIVLIDPTNKNPTVTLTLRNATLKRILDFVTESAGYQYEVQADAVVVRPGGETSNLDTAFFPITRATVLRMTGIGSGKADPLSSAGAANEGGISGGEAGSMKGFLQQAGVSFTIEGSSLAYDGSAIIVTQTARNIERIRNILARYHDVRQVEIESKFMEVQEGALEELGVNWNLSRRGIAQVNPSTGAPILDSNGRQVFSPQETYSTANVNRSLVGAFPSTSNGNALTISSTNASGGPNLTVPIAPASIPGGVLLGSTAAALANISGFVGEFDVTAAIRALSQKQGSDLLSSPKITVLSGNPANITVAQEMRYPQSYGEIQSQVGSSSGTGTGGAGVTITAGTPQEFTSRNVGVEMKVTPTVEEDDYSISLDLNPKVTEFEGFVEYGGPSIAISSGTTVTVPPGFYQPIFSVREITTKVTIWDGATLVMGGLTREEVKKVNDKVPFFGDLPLVGRLFRSKGESSQKRNLLIFVTANLVSPGGSPKKQNLKSTPANSLFQNPTIVTPASAEARTRDGNK
jgi:general secretion pathway protein D